MCLCDYAGVCAVGLQTFVPLSCLSPGEVAEVSVEMRSPGQPGIYQSKWRATTGSGAHFGGE